MSDIAIPVIVLSNRREDAELYNKMLRDAGHAVRCRGLRHDDNVEAVCEAESPHLIIMFADSYPARIEDVTELRQIHAPLSSLIVIAKDVDEESITAVLLAGAQDLVSIENKARICAVSEREFRTYRLEHSLQEALHSAVQYKKQLKAMLTSASNAIAVVQEGIVVEANQAWADLFSGSDIDAATGPLMDAFSAESHATLKSALLDCMRGRQERATIEIEGKSADSDAFPAKITLETTNFDGEPAVHLSVERDSDAATTPDMLVEQALHTDLATGFLQRRLFLELLTEKLGRDSPERARALAMIRPDGFEQIEADLGPVSSEEIVGQIADVLNGLLIEADLTGRFSGNVLALVIERDSLHDISTWAETALARISDHMFEAAGRSLSLTCSIGIAEIGSGMDRVEDLLRNAEGAMERARDGGGNLSILEETSDESTRIKRIDEIRVRQLKSALVENRLRLIHLSIASLEGRAERMFDTFVRLIDEQGDEVAAAEFMESAGRNGLLSAVDRWVIDASFKFCNELASDLVFVRFSQDSLLDTAVWRWLDKRGASAGVTRDRVCIQITEEVASQYQKQTVALAKYLKEQGFRFAIEHFGSGRDPLRTLKSVPMDFVKFDASYSQALTENSAIQDEIRRYVASAKQHGINTIATHVENANTMALLFQLGVTYMQGHYLHEPEVVLEAVV